MRKHISLLVAGIMPLLVQAQTTPAKITQVTVYPAWQK
jgi:hypothetical protein